MEDRQKNYIHTTGLITGISFAVVWTIAEYYLGGHNWLQSIGVGVLGGFLNYIILLMVTFVYRS